MSSCCRRNTCFLETEHSVVFNYTVCLWPLEKFYAYLQSQPVRARFLVSRAWYEIASVCKQSIGSGQIWQSHSFSSKMWVWSDFLWVGLGRVLYIFSTTNSSMNTQAFTHTRLKTGLEQGNVIDGRELFCDWLEASATESGRAGVSRSGVKPAFGIVTTPCPEKRGHSILGITLTNLDTVS